MKTRALVVLLGLGAFGFGVAAFLYVYDRQPRRRRDLHGPRPRAAVRQERDADGLSGRGNPVTVLGQQYRYVGAAAAVCDLGRQGGPLLALLV
jgi:hypothetical protein